MGPTSARGGESGMPPTMRWRQMPFRASAWCPILRNGWRSGRSRCALYETGQPHVQLTLEGVRAVMQATPDDDDEDNVEGSDRKGCHENISQAPSPA